MGDFQATSKRRGGAAAQELATFRITKAIKMAAPEDGPSGETPHKPGGDSETAGNTAHASAALVAAHEEPPPAEAEHVPSHILPSNFGSTFSWVEFSGTSCTGSSAR